MKEIAEQVKYTPVPWKAIKRGVGDDWVVVPVKHEKSDSWILAACTQQANDKANAEFIARAVNCHSDSMEALKLAQATIERLTVKRGPFSSTQGTQAVIRAAIAKAEGKQP